MKSYDYTTRIRYSETDQMRIAYYGRYFEWFEAARGEYIRALGLSYAEFEKKGYFLPVLEAQCTYHRPARYDEQLIVRTWVDQLKNSSLRFRYHLFRQGEKERLAEGYTIHAFVNRDMKPVRIPQEFRDAIEVVKE